MTRAVAITQVGIEPVHDDRLTLDMEKSGQALFEITTLVTNHSPEPQYVTSSVTRIRYEPESRLLTLFYGDDEGGMSGVATPVPPRQTVVPPGGTAAFKDVLISPMTTISRPAANAVSESATPLERGRLAIDADVDSLECAVAYRPIATDTPQFETGAQQSAQAVTRGRAVGSSLKTRTANVRRPI